MRSMPGAPDAPPFQPLPAAGAWVLAGGRSTRMGRDKALLPLSGSSLLSLALDKLRALHLGPSGTPSIAGSRPDLVSYAPVVEDLHPGCGPLGGIEAALAAAEQPLNLFIAVDLPLTPVGLLGSMLERAAITGALATYPRLCGRDQPLCAVYHRDLLPHLTREIEAGEYAVARGIESAIRQVAGRQAANRESPIQEPPGSTRHLDVFDLELLAAAYPGLHDGSALPLHLWFENCNSPQDSAFIERLVCQFGVHLRPSGGNHRMSPGHSLRTCSNLKPVNEPSNPERGNGRPPEPAAEIPADVPIEIVERVQREPARGNGEAQPQQTQHPYISFEHVYKSFGDLKVLDDVSFSVDPGKTLCILGRSGVGKSVALQHIMGFLKPDSGRIIVDGQDITQLNEKEMRLVRKKVTMVFQNGALFDSLSVGENVAFPLREQRELDEAQLQQVVAGLLDMVGVSGMTDSLPSNLSTGMKRAVAIARALASQPEAVLYDEPTTMVDPLMGRRLGSLIQRLKQQLKLTSVVVTHDMRLAARLADQVLFLSEGKAEFFGAMAEMQKTKDKLIREFLDFDAFVLPEA